MIDPEKDPGEYAAGVSDLLEGPWGQGFGAKVFNKDRSDNPHPIESEEWREWLRGFESAETASWQTIDVPNLDPTIIPTNTIAIQ